MLLPRLTRMDAGQALLVLVAVLLWWPALTTHYGITDDYSFLAYWSHPDLKVIGSDVMRMGRPFAAIIQRVAFLAYETVPELVWLRALSGAFLLWFGVLLFRFLQEIGWPYLRAWLAALLVLATPPFIVYVGWAITFVGPISAVAALWASCSYLRAFRGTSGRNGKPDGWRLAGALALLVTAACFYQPTACLFLLLPLAAATTDSRAPNEESSWLQQGGALVFFLGGLGLYFVLFRLTMSSLDPTDWASSRGELVSDFGAKARFLWSRPVADLLRLWTPLRPEGPSPVVWWASVGATLLAFVGLALRARSRWDGLARVASVLAILALAYLPIAAVAENTATYRTQAAPHAAWMLFLIGGLSGFVPLWKGLRLVGPALLVGFTAAYVLQGRHALHAGMVQPHAHEWTELTALLDSQVTPATTALCFRMPHGIVPSAGIRPHEEFGGLSTRTTWGATCLPLVHLRARFSRKFADSIPLLPYAPWRTVDPCGAVVIDAYQALSGDPDTPPSRKTFWGDVISTIQLPPFGEVQLYDARWVYSPRFGYAQVRNLPPLDRSTAPPTARVAPEEGLYFFLLCEGRWFWTSEGTFPIVHDLDLGKAQFILGENASGQPQLLKTIP